MELLQLPSSVKVAPQYQSLSLYRAQGSCSKYMFHSVREILSEESDFGHPSLVFWLCAVLLRKVGVPLFSMLLAIH